MIATSGRVPLAQGIQCAEQVIASPKRLKEFMLLTELQMRNGVRRLPVFIENHKGPEIHHLCQVTKIAVDSMTW